MKFLGLITVTALAFAGCSGGSNVTPLAQSGSQSQAAAVQQARPQQPTPSPAPTTASSLTGRIVYTNGSLHVYNVATKTDVSLNITGVNPKFSPDGTLITYQNGGIYVVNSDGTNNRLLNATGGVPSFDPTGTIVTYSNGGIWTDNINTGVKTQLTTAGLQSAYSPDGTQITYNASVSGSQQLFIMNADGTNAHQALNSASIIDSVWRPGKILFGLAAGKGYQLASYDPTTATLTQLPANGDEPSWSPDATHISWTGTSGKSTGIWIMNADGTGQQLAIAGGRQGSWGP